MQTKQRGFTLLEIIIVLALIGLIATVVLPALKRTTKFAMMDSIRSVTNQVTLAYNNAIFTGRVHRMVFDVKRGRFWTEIAPQNYTGRAPNLTDESESRKKLKESLYTRLKDQADNAESTETPLLEIPAHQKDILKEATWQTLKTNLIEPQTLIGDVVFVQISSSVSNLPIKYPLNFIPTQESESEKPNPNEMNYIYFFPSGTTTEASFQFGFRQNGMIDTNAPKYTLNLNHLTAQFQLLEGFEEANFELPK